MEKNYENLNAEVVAKELEEHIVELEKDIRKYNCRLGLRIRDVYKELSIFDWWKEELSLTDLKNMYSFITTAMDLGFRGYVCFKVGASGCANGMWCHKDVSTDGYSPDGDFIYRSFTPDYTEWDAMINDVLIMSNSGEKLTLRNLKKKLKSMM